MTPGYRQFAVVGSVVWFTVVSAVCLAMIHWEKEHSGWPSGLWTWANLAAGVVVIGPFAGGIYVDAKVITRLGFRCPACGKPFHAKSVIRAIRSSGRCRCGEPIVDGDGKR